MELLNSNYNDIYNYLLSIVKLNDIEYNKLVSIYGEASVDFVIESMILNDDNNLDKFSYFIDKKLFDIDFSSFSNLDIYLNEIGLSKRLSREENRKYSNEAYEIVNELKELFKIVCDVEYVSQDGILYNSILDQVDFYLKKCNDSDLYNKIVSLRERYIIVRDKLVSGNLRLVVSVLKRYYVDSDSFNDMIQNGNISLMRAVERYNPNFNTTFGTYAYYWIKQSMRYSSKNDISGCINVSYNAIDDNNLKLRAINVLINELGREPTKEEISSYMGISLERLAELDSTFMDVLSLYSTIPNYGLDGKSTLLIDTIEDRSVNICDEVCSKVGRIQLVDYLRNNLPEKQVEILLYRYGFYGEEKTLREIGEILNMSKQAVDLSKKRALARLGCLSRTRTKEFL